MINDILPNAEKNTQAQQVWIVFSGESEIRWIRWLFKRGFRHCYALIHDGKNWTTFDPLAHKTEVAVHHQLPGDFDLPGWLQQRGLRVIKAPGLSFREQALPPAFFTCVEAVKRLIGLRRYTVFTPYQLYKAIAV